jgi:hypothetical protein
MSGDAGALLWQAAAGVLAGQWEGSVLAGGSPVGQQGRSLVGLQGKGLAGQQPIGQWAVAQWACLAGSSQTAAHLFFQLS